MHFAISMLRTLPSESRPLQVTEGVKNAVTSLAGSASGIIHTRKQCAKLENNLDSAEAIYRVTCDELWACVNEPNFPALPLTKKEYNTDLGKPLRTTNVTKGENYLHEYIESEIGKELKNVEKQSREITSLDEYGKGNCFATNFEGSFESENEGDEAKYNYKCCCIFVNPSKNSDKMCFSMVHTHKSGDDSAENDNVFFNVYSSSVNGGFELGNEVSGYNCPVAVVVNSNPGTRKPVVLLNTNEHRTLLDFELNPLIPSMAVYKNVGRGIAVDVVHFKCLKSGCKLATLSRVELSDGSVDFMICRVSLDRYKIRTKKSLEESDKKKNGDGN